MAESKYYTIAWASPQSEDSDQHGNKWQTIIFEGYEPKIKILTKNPVEKGQHIYGFVSKEEKKSGGDYYRFRRQQVPDGVQRPQQGGSSDELLKLVKEIHAAVIGPVKEKETVLDDIDDNPVDLSDIPF